MKKEKALVGMIGMMTRAVVDCYYYSTTVPEIQTDLVGIQSCLQSIIDRRVGR